MSTLTIVLVFGEIQLIHQLIVHVSLIKILSENLWIGINPTVNKTQQNAFT
jgi:hypothetical protein